MDGGRPVLRDLTDEIHEMQRRLMLAREELAELEVTGAAEGVTVGMRGTGEVTQVVIDQAAVNTRDAAALSALVTAAFGKATDALRAATEEKMAAVSAGLSVAFEMTDAMP